MTDEFDKIVSYLGDVEEEVESHFEAIETILVWGAEIQHGWVEGHSDCQHSNEIIYITLHTIGGGVTDLGVPINSPFARAILSGALEKGCRDLMEEDS